MASDAVKFLITDDFELHRAIKAIQLVGVNRNNPYKVEIKQAQRSDMQNRKYHAMVGDIASQHHFYQRILTPMQWKILTISGHAIATGEKADVVCGLEGEYVNLRESTAEMGVKRMSSLIEYTTAYCVENGIFLRDR